MISKVIKKLHDPAYRKAFVAAQINIGIPFQIRGLLKSREWKQEDLVRRTGMLQPRISALLTPGKVRPNIETLRRIAEAFDCGIEIRFVPFSDLVLHSERFNPETFDVPSYQQEQERGVYEALPVYDMPATSAHWLISQASTTDLLRPVIQSPTTISNIDVNAETHQTRIPVRVGAQFIETRINLGD